MDNDFDNDFNEWLEELEQQEQERKEARAFIIRMAILLFASLTFVLGFITGAAS